MFKTVFQILLGAVLCSLADGRPNILVVMTDDQGLGQNSLYLNSCSMDRLAQKTITKRYTCDPAKALQAAQSAMPNLSKLSESGVRFSNAYVASPICSPSRTALITGRYPQRCGVYSNIDVFKGVPVSETFLPELLQKDGYRTAIIGKWHLGRIEHTKLPVQTRDYHKNTIAGCPEEHHPLSRGFNYYFGFNASGANFYDSPSIFRNHENVKTDGYLTDELTREAVQFITQNSKLETPNSKPFFIFLSYNAPHIPLDAMAPDKYLSRFNTGNREVDNYYASLAAVDDGIGDVFKTLEKTGQRENTLVFFLSDNGAVIDSPLPANGDPRGNKGQFFQGGTRVPMVASWPARLPAGKVFDGLVSAMDILPTALAAAGIKVPESLKLDGVDLVPHVTGVSKEPLREALFWSGPRALHWGEENTAFWCDYDGYIKGTFDSKPLSKYVERYSSAAWAVRSGKWVLHYWAKDNSYALYDLESDPAETDDLASKYPEIVDRLKPMYAKWIADKPAPRDWKIQNR